MRKLLLGVTVMAIALSACGSASSVDNNEGATVRTDTQLQLPAGNSLGVASVGQPGSPTLTIQPVTAAHPAWSAAPSLVGPDTLNTNSVHGKCGNRPECMAR